MPKNEGSRPTVWIVVTCVLAVAVVGLAVWAFSAQSDADDARADLAAQTQAAADATPAPTAEPAAVPTVDPETRAAFEQVATDIGATSESLQGSAQQILDQAKTKLESAEQARDEANGALETARAEAEEVRARFELTSACLRGTFDALSTAFETGGLSAAVEQLQALSSDCADATSS